MADTKAKPVTKAERKKPVRKSPALKDYPNRLAWLRAMTEYETAQAEADTAAKIDRLDKRIQAKLSQVEAHRAQLDRLTAERAVLAGHTPLSTEQPEAEAETPSA